MMHHYSLEDLRVHELHDCPACEQGNPAEARKALVEALRRFLSSRAREDGRGEGFIHGSRMRRFFPRNLFSIRERRDLL